MLQAKLFSCILLCVSTLFDVKQVHELRRECAWYYATLCSTVVYPLALTYSHDIYICQNFVQLSQHGALTSPHQDLDPCDLLTGDEHQHGLHCYGVDTVFTNSLHYLKSCNLHI